MVDSKKTYNWNKKIFIISSGAGIIKRGFETTAITLFESLHSEGFKNVFLIKGGGKKIPYHIRIINFNRFSIINRLICKLIKAPQKNYYIEFLSFSFFLIPYILFKHPKIIYVLEGPIYNALLVFKKLLRLNFILIHSSGGQIVNQRPDQNTIIHHVTPFYLNKAISLGFKKENQVIIPRYINFKQQEFISEENITRFKNSNNIPTDKKIILSVGSIDSSVKRMDYIIKELEYIKNEYFLILLGQFSEETEYVLNLARNKLGKNNFLIKTVSREEINYYYQASDIFVLASLKEGFGLVYLEALANGLPVIAHDFEVSRYVLKDEGIYLDLSQYGALRKFLTTYQYYDDLKIKNQRFQFVYDNYSWDVLKKDYLKLFGLDKNE